MPLFNCTSCSTVENTALSNYWADLYQHDKSVPFNPLCSKCDPRIGEWHGRFPRRYEPVPDQSLAPSAPRLLNAMREADAPSRPAPRGPDNEGDRSNA